MWKQIENASRLIAALPVPAHDRAGVKTVLKRVLPFYRNAVLVKFDLGDESYMGITSAIEDGPVFWLDGTGSPIHDANRAFGLELNDQNVTEYVRFYSEFMLTPDGKGFQFEIVVGGVKRFADLGYRIEGIVNYDGDLFCVEMAVSMDGLVKMLRDYPTRH
jgi:hypothetical protein